MSIGPATYLRFLADHAELLIELARRETIREAEYMQMVRRHAKSLTPEYLLDCLREYGIVEYVPGASASVELAVPVADLLHHIVREERLTSPKVVEGYFESVEGLSVQLDGAIVSADGTAVASIVRELAREIEKMRSDSARSREAIFREIERLKTNAHRLPLVQRLLLINRLWEHHVHPMREMLGGRLRGLMGTVHRVLANAVDRFANDGVLSADISIAGARLARLQRALFDDLYACVATVTPLQEQVRRESTIARGAALLLERSLQPAEWARLAVLLPIQMFRREGLLDDEQLREEVARVSQYEPSPPERIPEPTGEVPPMIVTQGLVIAQLLPALPVDDALGWLISRIPSSSLPTILKAFSWLLRPKMKGVKAILSGDRCAHRFADVTVAAPRVRLEAA